VAFPTVIAVVPYSESPRCPLPPARLPASLKPTGRPCFFTMDAIDCTHCTRPFDPMDDDQVQHHSMGECIPLDDDASDHSG
jgi:hypothetical protein